MKQDKTIELYHQASIRLLCQRQEKIRTLLEQIEVAPNEQTFYALVRQSQETAVECRALYRRAKSPQESDKAIERLSELGYRCERLGKTMRMELPLLLPSADTTARFC